MPELPEVETIKRSLSPLVAGKAIIKVEIVKDVVVAYPEASVFADTITGARIGGLDRRGKYLLIHLDRGTLVVHLRMTGRLFYVEPQKPKEKHTHVIFTLDDNHELRFSDVRRFGRLWLFRQEENREQCGICRLGPEPFAKEFNAVYLRNVLSARKVVIKQALLDQSVVAGLGNIYVDEVLYAASIAPNRTVGEITDCEWQKLAEVIPQILEKAIQNRGTTFSDFRDGEGKAGDNFAYLKAYHREGEACSRCGGRIKRIRLAGRSSFYCPECQK